MFKYGQLLRLIKTIEVNCQLWGLQNITTGDFNFDGFRDFSVFESSYAGVNTTRLYFLYHKATKSYIDSQFTGTSLEFNPKIKTIQERN
jgi:hypothetical protein